MLCMARLIINLTACFVAMVVSGCLIPIGSKVSSGHRHSAEALAFLDQPGATREEVITTLGPPLIESQHTRTLVYVWHEMLRYLDLTRDPDSQSHSATDSAVVYGSPEEYALFVAYDERGLILGHEVRYVDGRSLEDECRDWYRERNQE